MNTVTRCQVCGGVCLTTWQIETRTCAACMEHAASWREWTKTQ